MLAVGGQVCRVGGLVLGVDLRQGFRGRYRLRFHLVVSGCFAQASVGVRVLGTRSGLVYRVSRVGAFLWRCWLWCRYGLSLGRPFALCEVVDLHQLRIRLS